MSLIEPPLLLPLIEIQLVPMYMLKELEDEEYQISPSSIPLVGAVVDWNNSVSHATHEVELEM